MRPSDEMNEPAQRSAVGSFNPKRRTMKYVCFGYYDKNK
jgi:hypothetical protein